MNRGWTDDPLADDSALT